MRDRPAGSRRTVVVFRHGDRYYARYDDPLVLLSDELDTLPTSYSAAHDPLTALLAVATLNPEADVVLAAASARTARHCIGADALRNAPSMN